MSFAIWISPELGVWFRGGRFVVDDDVDVDAEVEAEAEVEGLGGGVGRGEEVAFSLPLDLWPVFRFIMLIAHPSRSTGVRFAACKKASRSYNSLGVGRSSDFFSKHLATNSCRIGGKASLLGSLGAGSCTICCRRSRIPMGPALARFPAAESDESNGNRPTANSMTDKPTLQTSDRTV